MPDAPVIELPAKTKLVFAGGAERVVPISPNDMRSLIQRAGQQGALFITVPLIAGALDFNLTNLCYFEQAFNDPKGG